MRFEICMLVCVILAGCHKKQRFDDTLLIGHAGSGLKASTSPYTDNTYEAVDYALSMDGIDGVEVDIQYSATHTAWLFHDELLADRTNGSGCVPESGDEALDQLRYNGLEKEKLLKLAGLPALHGKRVFLDVRSYNRCANALQDQQIMIEAIEQAYTALPEEITVVTNNPDWIHGFYLKGWKVYFNIASVSAYLDHSLLSETTGICIRNAEVSKEDVEKVHDSGKEVVIFDVRSPKGIRKALRKFPDVLMTDNLKAAIIEKYP